MINKFTKKEYIVYIKYIAVILIVIICGCIYLYQKNNNKQNDNSLQQNIKIDIDDNAVDNSLKQEESSVSADISNGDKDKIYVHVCGAIVNPGVYTCEADSRLFEVVELAGGFAQDADETYLNLVDKVTDGQKIYVPSIDEIPQDNSTGTVSGDNVSGQIQRNTSSGNSISNGNSGLININTATKEQLMTLPGIGESKAADIIDYRNSIGSFNKPEDIKNISGIKEAAYAKIKDMICI